MRYFTRTRLCPRPFLGGDLGVREVEEAEGKQCWTETGQGWGTHNTVQTMYCGQCGWHCLGYWVPRALGAEERAQAASPAQPALGRSPVGLSVCFQAAKGQTGQELVAWRQKPCRAAGWPGGRSPPELDSVGVPHVALGSGPTPRPAVPGDPQWRLVSRPRRMARGQQPGCPGAFWSGTWLEFPCPAPASSESPPRSALSGPGWEEGQRLSPSWEARPRERRSLWAQLGRLCGAAGGDRCV